MKKRLFRIGIATLAFLTLVLSVIFRADLAARSATGLTAHSLCSARFVAGLDADATFGN